MKTFIHKYLFIAVMFTATVLPCVAVNITNTIPFTNSFEQYSHNQDIAGTNGWFADSNVIIVVANDAGIYDEFGLSNVPLTNENHNYILTLDGSATNAITNTSSEIWIDMMVQPKRWSDDYAPVIPTNTARTAFYFNSNGHIVVYGKWYDDVGDSNYTTWAESTTYVVGTGNWSRLTVELQLDEFGEEWIRTKLDATPIVFTHGVTSKTGTTTPGPWLQVANTTPFHKLTGLVLSGTGNFDDLQITTNNPSTIVKYAILLSIIPPGSAIGRIGDFLTHDSASVSFEEGTDPNITIFTTPPDGYLITNNIIDEVAIWPPVFPPDYHEPGGANKVYLLTHKFTSISNNHTYTIYTEAQPRTLIVTNIGLAATSSPAEGSHAYVYNQSIVASSTDSNPLNTGTERHACDLSLTGSGSESGTATTKSFNLTDDNTLLAWNWHLEYILNAKKISQHETYTGSDGTLSIASTSWHNEGSNVVVVATPSASAAGTWSFDSWSGDTAGSVIDTNQITVTMNNANTNLIANFIYTPNSSNWTLTVASANGTPVPAVGTVLGILDGTVTNCIIDQDIAEGVGTQQHCTGWIGTGSAPSSGATTNTGLFLVTDDSSVTWNWVTQYELTMTVVGNGSVDVTAGISWQTANESITITAAPDSGSTFAGWTGTNATDTVISSNQINILMGAKRSITATFTGGTTQTQTTHGTPYTWLDQFGLTNHDADDLIDQDFDGLFTWEEYITGTDPTDSNSVFRVLNIQTLGGTNYLTFYGTTNGVTLPFGIERSTNLVTGDGWQLYSTKNRESSGTNLWMDPAPPAAGIPVFYRPVATNQ